jgi:hypothetical protein
LLLEHEHFKDYDVSKILNIVYETDYKFIKVLLKMDLSNNYDPNLDESPGGTPGGTLLGHICKHNDSKTFKCILDYCYLNDIELDNKSVNNFFNKKLSKKFYTLLDNYLIAYNELPKDQVKPKKHSIMKMLKNYKIHDFSEDDYIKIIDHHNYNANIRRPSYLPQALYLLCKSTKNEKDLYDKLKILLDLRRKYDACFYTQHHIKVYGKLLDIYHQLINY